LLVVDINLKEFSAAVFMRLIVVEINSILSIYEILISSVMLRLVDFTLIIYINITLWENGVLQLAFEGVHIFVSA